MCSRSMAKTMSKLAIVFAVGVSLMPPECFALSEYDYAKDGQICYRTGGKRNFEHCRPPKDKNELANAQRQTNEKNAYYAKYNYCDFSMFSTWGGERGRLTKKLESAKFSYDFASKEVFWAKQDIAKQAYLPSETVREAYSTLGIYQPIMNKASYEIGALNWCIECAKAQQKGSADCRHLP